MHKFSNQKDINDGAFLTKAIVISGAVNNAYSYYAYRHEQTTGADFIFNYPSLNRITCY